MKEPLDLFIHIKKVETPPFLKTRVLEKIKAIENNTISKKEVISWAVACIVVISLNILIIFGIHQKSNKQSDLNQFAKSLHLNTPNNLY